MLSAEISLEIRDNGFRILLNGIFFLFSRCDLDLEAIFCHNKKKENACVTRLWWTNVTWDDWMLRQEAALTLKICTNSLSFLLKMQKSCKEK